jgi:hypothetical protein
MLHQYNQQKGYTKSPLPNVIRRVNSSGWHKCHRLSLRHGPLSVQTLVQGLSRAPREARRRPGPRGSVGRYDRAIRCRRTFARPLCAGQVDIAATPDMRTTRTAGNRKGLTSQRSTYRPTPPRPTLWDGNSKKMEASSSERRLFGPAPFSAPIIPTWPLYSVPDWPSIAISSF